MTLLIDIGLAIGVSTLLSYITFVLKQPNLLAYILTGLLIGPLFFGMITDSESIKTLGELGVAFLLFTAGMELDARKLKNVGDVAFIGGIVQVIVSFGIGYLIASALGFGFNVSVMAGLLLAFSSTMLVTKMLMDKNEINALHGKIMIGILLLQDLVALIILFAIANPAGTGAAGLAGAGAVGAGIGGAGLVGYKMLAQNVLILLATAAILNQVIFKNLMTHIAKDPQLLFMTAVTTLFLFMGMALMFNLPMTAAALIAGLAISSTPFSMGALAEIRPLRVFFSSLFFVALGMQINPFIPNNLLALGIVILIATVLLKPLLLFGEYTLLGYGFATSALIGIYLGQASEFSFIIIQQGLSTNFITAEIATLMTMVVVVSMVITPYMAGLSRLVHRINKKIELPYFLRWRVQSLEQEKRGKLEGHILVIGCHRIGYNIAKYLSKKKESLLVIDHDPETIYRIKKDKLPYLFGDAESEEILELARADKAKMVIITVVDMEATLFVTEWVRARNKDSMIIARAHKRSDALALYSAGADWVVVPEMVGSSETVRQVDRFLEMPEDRFEDEKERHISELKKYIE